MSEAVIAAKHTVGQEAVASLKDSAVLGAQIALLAAGYYLAARLGLGFRFQNSQIGVVWPANAVLFSALLLVPIRRWWLVILATALAHIAAADPSVPGWRILWQICGNSLFTITTVGVLRRTVGLPLDFATRRHVAAYTVISFAMPAVYAFTTPAFVRSMLGLEANYSPTAALLRVVLTNSTAMILVAPVVLLWVDHGGRRLKDLPKRRLIEAAAIMLSLLIVGLVVFGTGPEIARFPSLLLWIFPPLLWAAVRFGPTGASTSLFFVAAMSVAGTARQLGPFVVATNGDKVIALQLFWVVMCPPVMLLAALIREREQAEDALEDQRKQLAHVTRVATVGELSGTLAHELRQPLAAILSNAQAGIRLLDRGVMDRRELRAILEDITQQDKQAASVIARLRAFLKEGESRFETLAVETVVRDALALGKSVVELAGVEVDLHIAPALPRVRGDAVQLLQVLLNLLVNSCESMMSVPKPYRQLRLLVAPRGDEYVEVLMADCGVGLPKGGEDRVFEAFFTTKDKGLGLGLAIGRSIATAHGGRLWGENNPHRGATFHLLLRTDQAYARPATADCNR